MRLLDSCAAFCSRRALAFELGARLLQARQFSPVDRSVRFRVASACLFAATIVACCVSLPPAASLRRALAQLLLQFRDVLARFLRPAAPAHCHQFGTDLLQSRQFLLQLSVARLRLLPVCLGLFVCRDRRRLLSA
jgi:hypothetical protein